MGTTYIKPSGQGGDYTSLAAWEAGQQGTLTEPEIAIIDGDWTGVTDTTRVAIDGWTTSASNYIYIYTSFSARHDGKWNDTKYRYVISDWNNAMAINEENIRIDGLQIAETFVHCNQATLEIASFSETADIRISNSIFWRPSWAGNAVAIGHAFTTGAGTIKIWNLLIYGGGHTSGIVPHGLDWYIYNTTIYGCTEVGILRWYGNVIVKNTISYNNTTNYSGTFAGGCTNNLSGPTQTNAPGSNPRNGVTVTFVDPDNGDFHLASNDAGARNYGADLSSDANLAFSDDIDGQTRPGESVWDIGADEYIPEGVPIPVLMQNMRGGFVRARGGFIN